MLAAVVYSRPKARETGSQGVFQLLADCVASPQQKCKWNATAVAIKSKYHIVIDYISSIGCGHILAGFLQPSAF